MLIAGKALCFLELQNAYLMNAALCGRREIGVNHWNGVTSWS